MKDESIMRKQWKFTFLLILCSATLLSCGSKVNENYTVRSGDLTIDFTITWDQLLTFPDDYYEFEFRHSKYPGRKLILDTESFSRCWTINQSSIDSSTFYLIGCNSNNGFAYKIDFTNNSCTSHRGVIENINPIDSLHELYFDEQLPPNYVFPEY